ncbi:MAG TPA: hypothetical protein VFJ21_12620, partial [Mycobacteriales bacterium]|nr:hypothetical protein [Mycobacteriales bacterium]
VARVPSASVAAYSRRGWSPIDGPDPTAEPGAKATRDDLVEWASGLDPENTDAIAAMTKAELREQYGDNA